LFHICDIRRKQNKRFYSHFRQRMLTAVVVLPDGTKIAVACIVFRSADLPLRPTSFDHCTHAVCNRRSPPSGISAVRKAQIVPAS
jgi:hypothetical protein